ncbi:unnamed protein product [Parascedosporium putredinis]|uniref:Deacetylase sirtuin-type domain-containing protein n=1 Tax=Parascedosporium putredinis TaxID=1442378 RepID=A0A9P1GWD6_9PEZI|nr:unnamed protein product [Parascedosporium putredinis]CAI7988231.1 unnamed protein product [Parascedosporium putredinis]
MGQDESHVQNNQAPQVLEDRSLILPQEPRPFYVLAKELYPGNFHPTLSHAFISLLAHKGLLHKLFTQNIDCLERQAGVPPERIIEAHGSFATQRCIDCKKPYPDDLMKMHINKAQVPRCAASGCSGLVKPDIVFFGEPLPADFGRNSDAMFAADLVIIMGTSLTVYPFAALPDMTRPKTPRVLFNLERVGTLGGRPDDVLQLGTCDLGVKKLAEELGWLEELNKLWEETVGDKEVAKQRARHETPDADLEAMDDEIVGSLLESIEGISLKDHSSGGHRGDTKAHKQRPSSANAKGQTGSSPIVLPKAIVGHLESHLQDKLTSGAATGSKLSETTSNGSNEAATNPKAGGPDNSTGSEVGAEKAGTEEKEGKAEDEREPGDSNTLSSANPAESKASASNTEGKL